MDSLRPTARTEEQNAGSEEPGLNEVSDCLILSRYLQVDLKTILGLAQRVEISCRKLGKAYPLSARCPGVAT